jgi:anaerobic magnesium-protoporphyrin IX monomethyl ester cyclase
MFYDDELNVSKSFVDLMNGLSDMQMRIGAEFRLRGFVKSELFTKEQAEAMVRAGFRWLLCGFEAANERILVNIDKRAKLADNDRCVEFAKAAGLKVKALMSCGHPGESEQTITDIRDWLIRNRVDDFDCTVITTYPGTPYYDLAVPHATEPDVWTYTHPKTGDRLHAREVDYTVCADYYKGDPNGGYRSFVFTDHLSPERLVELRDMVERDVRAALNIPFNPGAPALRYEHSMGQGLPDFIHRVGQQGSAGTQAQAAEPPVAVAG